jgi:hypothetical protein
MDVDFYNRTRLDATIVSLVSTRISNSFESDNTYPKIVYMDINAGIRAKSHNDIDTGDVNDLYESMVQVDVFGRDRDEVAPVVSRLIAMWDEYRRTAYGATDFLRVELVRNDNFSDMPMDNSERGIYHQSLDFKVWWRVV